MHAGEFLRNLHVDGGHALRSFLQLGVGHHHRTDGSVRTNERTLVTLDTLGGIPFRNHGSDTAFFVCGGASRECTINDFLECADRQVVTALCHHRTHHLVDEFRIVGVALEHEVGGAIQLSPFSRNVNLGDFTAAVNSCIVHVHDILTLLAVRLHDEFLHLLHSEVVRNDAGNLEECRLQDGVGTVAQTDLSSDLRSVDDVHVDVVEGQVFLHEIGKMFLGFSHAPRRVVEERTVLLQTAQTVIFLQVRRNVNGHEIGRTHEVRSQDGLVAETEVRTGVTA